MTLAPLCVTNSLILHELGHVIGFYHEHSRPDRDDYVNVGSTGNRNLDRIPNGNTLGLGYDYASIMHYGGLNGIITPKIDVPFGNAQELSPLDIEKARRLYRCGQYA
jgi:hypothetical protein